jgi:hypothetical protein
MRKGLWGFLVMIEELLLPIKPPPPPSSLLWATATAELRVKGLGFRAGVGVYGCGGGEV